MKNSLKGIGIVMLIITATVSLVNEYLEKDLENKIRSLNESKSTKKNAHLSSLNEGALEDYFTTDTSYQDAKKNEVNDKNHLDFFSNGDISFKYPKEFVLEKKEMEFSGNTMKSVKLELGTEEHFHTMLVASSNNSALSSQSIMKSTLKGFLKGYDNYKILESGTKSFNGNHCDYKSIVAEQYTVEFHCEALSFEKNKKSIVVLKVSDSKQGLNQCFKEIEKSFEVLSNIIEPNKSDDIDVSAREKLAQNGDKLSQVFLAVAYLTGDGAPRNYERAFYWNQKLAKSGYAGAMKVLGWQYKEGIGVEKDLDKGNFWIKEAKKNGYE